MSRYSDALRRVIYALDCSLGILAKESKISRTTLYDVMHGHVRARYNTARALTIAVVGEIDREIARKEEEIKELREIRIELCGAYNMEFGGGANGGNNDGVEKP